MQDQDQAARFMHRFQGLAGWLGLLAGLWVMGSLAWANFTAGETVGGVVLLMLTIPAAFISMRGAFNLSRYPAAAILTIMQLLKRQS